METTKNKLYRKFTGIVASTEMAKTAVVVVERTLTHKKYLKQYKTSRRYKIHDEKNVCKVGDKVVFQECRPLSRDKRWRFVEVVK